MKASNDNKIKNHIKIFVSSTFLDMDIERDLIRNVIEPRLNDYLASYQYSLEFVDLRHSVQTDSTLTQKERERRIFSVCIDEIERCEPFFIGFIGHRYGWVPYEDGVDAPDISVPDDFPIKKRDMSVTLYEFCKGIFSYNSPKQPIIYIRDKDSYDSLSESKYNNFFECGEKAELIGSVRDYLENSDQILTKHYSMPQERTPIAVKVDFCNMIYEDILQVLSQSVDLRSEDKRNDFETLQNAFVMNRLRGFRGRNREIEELKKKIEVRSLAGIDAKYPGTGISATICKLYDIYKSDPANLCLFYSHKAMPYCDKRLETIFYNWILILNSNTGCVCNAEIEKAIGNSKKLLKIFKEQLDDLESRGVNVYAFSDVFLGGVFHKNLKVLHRTPGVDTMESLRPFTYILGSYTDETFDKIIMSQRPNVIEILRGRQCARNAQWLDAALNILNKLQLTDFTCIRKMQEADNEEKITRYQVDLAKSLPDDFFELLSFWIDRLKNNIEVGLTDKFLFLLSMSSQGLYEKDLIDIIDCEPLLIIMLRQMLGRQIVIQSVDGRWKLASDEVKTMVSSMFKIAEHRDLIKKAYQHISMLDPNSMSYQDNVFTYALLYGDIPFCYTFICEHGREFNSPIVSRAYNAWTELAAYDSLWFLNLFSRLLDIREFSYKFFFNLSEWAVSIEEDNTQFALLLADRIESKLTNLHNNREIDDHEYSLKANILYFKCKLLSKMEDYTQLVKVINLGFSLTAEWYAIDSNWLNYYFHFLKFKLIGCQSFDLYFKLINKYFLVPYRTAKFSIPSNMDTGSYVEMLHQAAEVMIGNDNIPSAEMFERKAIDEVFSLVQKQRKDHLSQNALEEDSYLLLSDIILSVTDLHRDYGLFDANLMGRFVSESLKLYLPVLELKDSNRRILQNYFKLLLQKTLLESATPEDTIINLVRLTDKIISGLSESSKVVDDDNPITPFILFSTMERFSRTVSSEAYSVINTWSVIAEILADIHPQKVDLTKIEEPLCVSKYFKLDVDYVRSMLMPIIRSKGIDNDGLPNEELYEPVIRLLLAIAKTYCVDGNVELQRMIDLYNSISRMFDKINCHKFLVRKRMKQDVNNLVSEIKKSLSRYPEPENLNFDSIYLDYTDAFGQAGDTFIREDVYETGEYDLYDFCASVSENGKDLYFDITTLDQMIKNEEYEEIISSLSQRMEIGINEMYYLGLSYLRTGDFLNAFQVYSEMLSSEEIICFMSEGFYLSCLTNYMISALKSYNYEIYDDVFDSLNDEEREDEDIIEIDRLYREARLLGKDDIDLPIPLGFPL